jgi:hypothetical protein
MANNIFKKIIDGLLPKDDSPIGGKGAKSDTFTNAKLVNELVECFDYELENRSVRNRMLYPMSFNILLHPDDYAAREEDLRFVLPEVVSAFYDEIKKYQSKYANYTPAAKYWFFRISPCATEYALNEKDTILVEKGVPFIMARLLTQETPTGNTATQTNVRVTVKPKNSDVYSTVNINMAAMTGIDELSKGVFKIKFDLEKRNAILLTPEEEQNAVFADRLATLTYSEGNQNKSFYMIDNLIYISGKNDTRTGSHILKLENNEIENGHVQIKKEGNLFKLAAFGKVRKNSTLVPPSVGGNIEWVNLPHNSEIFINDSVNIKFLINK